MRKQEQLIELAMIGVILGDHFAQGLYKKMQEQGTGYVSTFEQIGGWAVEFYYKHKETNWDEALQDMKPLSREVSSVLCWDDCVIDFGFYKLAQI
jgi:hypothetical protein